jgi:hypothetical protein
LGSVNFIHLLEAVRLSGAQRYVVDFSSFLGDFSPGDSEVVGAAASDGTLVIEVIRSCVYGSGDSGGSEDGGVKESLKNPWVKKLVLFDVGVEVINFGLGDILSLVDLTKSSMRWKFLIQVHQDLGVSQCVQVIVENIICLGNFCCICSLPVHLGSPPFCVE